MRWILPLALWLLAPGICRADGLPAAGAALALKPTPSGYEVRIDLPPQKFVEARISSPDPGLSALLKVTSWKEETPPAPTPPAAPAPPAATPLKLLTVTLTSGAIAQGQYPVTLSLAGTEPKTVDFLLVVPAARTEPIDTLIVYRNRWPGDTVANQPQILESSGRQWLTNISLMQRGETDAGPEPAGRLHVKGKIADLPPGGSRLIELGKDYALDGDFPLGIAKGKLVLKADQLAEPVNFTFEIHSRILFVWMLVPMVLGLLLGWASRNWLTGQLNLAREKEKPLALLTAIEASLARNADSAFQAAAQAAWNDAKRATQLRTKEEVQAAATAAQTKFDAAVAALATRRAAFDMALAEFRAVVETPYRLPAEAEQSMLLMRRHLDDGLEGVAPNDVELAGRALDEAHAGFGRAIVQASHAWERTMTALAAALEALVAVAGPTVTADTVKALRLVEQTVTQARQKIEATPLPTVELIKALLEALHGGIYSVESLLSQFAAAIEQEIALARRILGPLSLQDDAAWARWTAAARQRATMLTKLAVSDPAQLMEILGAAGEFGPARDAAGCPGGATRRRRQGRGHAAGDRGRAGRPVGRCEQACGAAAKASAAGQRSGGRGHRAVARRAGCRAGGGPEGPCPAARRAAAQYLPAPRRGVARWPGADRGPGGRQPPPYPDLRLDVELHLCGGDHRWRLLPLCQQVGRHPGRLRRRLLLGLRDRHRSRCSGKCSQGDSVLSGRG